MAGVEERYQLLIDDPDISKVEAHRVFCGRCEKWLKLDETKLYAASVWRCHKNTKSHNAKAQYLSASAPPPAEDPDSSTATDRNSSASGSLSSNLQVKQEALPTNASPRLRSSADGVKHDIVDTTPPADDMDAQQELPRVKLKMPTPVCSDTVPVASSLRRAVSAASPSPSASIAVPGSKPGDKVGLSPSHKAVDNVSEQKPVQLSPLHSRHKNTTQSAVELVPSTDSDTSSPRKPAVISKVPPAVLKSVLKKEKESSSAGASPSKDSHPRDLYPDRRPSYDALAADPLIEILEPFRAFCSVCEEWVELSSRTPYSYGVWKGHVRKNEKHIRLRAVQAENGDDSASENSQGGCEERLASLDKGRSTRTNGTNGCPPSSPGSCAKPEGTTGDNTDIQVVDGEPPNGTEGAGDQLSSPVRIVSSFVTSHVFTTYGVGLTKGSENPFTLKATTTDSFGPRHKAPGNDSMLSDEDIEMADGRLIPTETSARNHEVSQQGATPKKETAQVPKIAAIKEERKHQGSNKGRTKLTPLKALEKRRDSMLADSEAEIVESRRVLCRMCQRWIKGSSTQEYSSHHWLKHKNKCVRSQKRENDRWSETAESRKQRLEADPDLEVLEAHRALCKLCHKWVKLCSRSRYSSSHWSQHKKKCPAIMGEGSTQVEQAESSDVQAGPHMKEDEKTVQKKQSHKVNNVEERRATFLADPDVAQVFPDRVKCKICNRWIKLGKALKYNTVNWLLHKECCLVNTADCEGKQQGTLEARRKVLEDDDDVVEFEPYRVLCRVCKSWVKLRPDCPYSLGKWLVHRRACCLAGPSDDERAANPDSHEDDAGDNDAREALDVENWLKDEPDMDSGGNCHDLPQNSAAPLSGRVDGGPSERGFKVAEDHHSDQDVEMKDGTAHSHNSNPTNLDAKNDVNDGNNGRTRESMQRVPDNNASERLSRRGRQAGVDHHPNPSLGRRRGRGKVQSRPIRPLPKSKARAAGFMRGQAPTTLPPIPTRPRWPDEDERKQQFVSDPDVLRVEPHRLLCKNCNCWIRLHPIIRYSQSVWPRHKESCKEILVLAAGDAKSRAKSEKEDARQRLLDDDPYATDVSPHRVTCKACGTNIRLDTTYKYEGSHWRAHRSRCTRIPFQERLAKKRKVAEQAPQPAAVAEFSDSDDSDASSAPRPRPTSYFTAPLIIKPTEMFRRRPQALTPSSPKVAAAKAQREAELAAELEKVAAEIEDQGRFSILLQLYGDGITSEEQLARAKQEEQLEADDEEMLDLEDDRGPPRHLSPMDSESCIPRKRSREEDEEFDAFFRQQPVPPSPVRPKAKIRACKLGKDAMQALD